MCAPLSRVMPTQYVLWRPEPGQRLLPGLLLTNGLQGRTEQGFAELLLEDAMNKSAG